MVNQKTAKRMRMESDPTGEHEGSGQPANNETGHSHPQLQGAMLNITTVVDQGIAVMDEVIKIKERLNSACILQSKKIERLKYLLARKLENESRATNAERRATIAEEKIVQLEMKLKAKEDEVDKVSRDLEKVREATNTFISTVKNI